MSNFESPVDTTAPGVREVHTLAEYREAFEDYQPARVDGLYGRILKGCAPADFDTLTHEASRKIVMLMGSDGLSLLPGQTGYDMLLTIGYKREYIAKRLAQGMDFRLVVFPEQSVEPRLATWDGMLNITSEVYPQAAPALAEQRDALKQTPLTAIEAQAGYAFADVGEPEDDARNMTIEQFEASPQDLVAVRGLLYFTVHLRELYAGDGYTYTPDGQRGLLEYAILNRPIHELGESDMLDVPVEIPA